MHKQVKIWMVAGATIFAAASAMADCNHSRKLAISPIDASGVKIVRIDASAGSLEVVGSATHTIRAGGKACASTTSRLEGIELTADRRGDEVLIRVEIESTHGSFFRRSYASLDLQVELPLGMNVEIEDGSGGIEISGVGALDIDDGSGPITVKDSGAVRIDDGSGGIHLMNIRGDVSIEDGSGEIVVRNVAGSVRVDDGSGSLEISGAGGDVIIVDDGSGSIRVTDIRGDLRVGDHGSGGLSFDRIDGKVSVRD